MTRRVSRALRGRHWILTAVVALAVVGAGLGTPAGAADDRSGLPEAIDTLLGDARMAGGAASVMVADARTGGLVYQHQADGRLMPASNTKLLTSAAAMAVLGPGHRFTTDVLHTGERHGSDLDGDLYLRGTGDPTLLAGDYDKLARAVADSGVRRVTGRLVADDTRFDDQRLGWSWGADDESAYYEAQISALSVAPDTDYDTGTVIVQATPGTAVGAKPHVTVTPPNHYVRLDVRATTVAKGKPAGLTVGRAHGTNTITVGGTLPVGGATAKEWVTVWEPTGYAAAVFRDALAAHGVQVDGGTQLGRATPTGARTLATHGSMQLKDLLVPFLELSNNMHAESLTKAIGYATAGKGTWDAGLAGIGRYLKGAGVDTGALRQVDGSGLSRVNSIPARQFVRLLLKVQSEPWFADWYRALPVACDPDRMVGGTLRTRMCGTRAAHNARGKTGSLTGVSALSGYVTDAGGRRLVYSIVLNGFLADSVKSLEDAVVETLAASDVQHAVLVRPGTARVAQRRSDLECSWLKPARC
ncbi:D-alanyl-D-alanine carboxypeptidase/D-alanyl-D-alanine endopeptidase [Streptomyces sp. NPDC002004]